MTIDNEAIEKQLDDHEGRIRRLEESDIKQQMQLAEIQKTQAELKVLVIETNREQNKSLERFADKMIDTISNTLQTKNQIKLIDRKEVWGVIALIVGGLITYFSK